MAGNIGVDISVVINTAADIRSEKNTMKTNLTGISDAVSNLKRSWQSESANALSTIASKMNSKFADLDKSVEQFAVFLDGVAANRNARDATVRDLQRAIDEMKAAIQELNRCKGMGAELLINKLNDRIETYSNIKKVISRIG